MNENYRVVFPKQCEIALETYDLAPLQENDMLLETEVSQISIGTELTLLEANVDADSPWWQNIQYPGYPGYACVSRIKQIGKSVPVQMLGKRIMHSGKHQSTHILDYRQTDLYCIVPEAVSSQDASLATIGTITMGSIRISQMRPGDVCVVYGAGLIGQMLARFARNVGAATIFVTDVSDNRLGKLPDDPCFIPINSVKVDAIKFILDHTEGRGADIVFETTGVPSLVDQEMRCLSKRGKLIITSSPKGKSLVDLDYCNRKGITIIGAHNFTVHTPVETPADRWTRHRDCALFLEMLDKKMISVKEMITHRFMWTDAVDVYKMLMRDRTQALSVNLVWQEEIK